MQAALKRGFKAFLFAWRYHKEQFYGDAPMYETFSIAFREARWSFWDSSYADDLLREW